MEETMNFDVNGLLSPEEAERLFDEGAGERGEPGADEVTDDANAVDAGAEEAGGPDGGDAAGGAEAGGEAKGDAATEGAGASPDDVLYSSIARALKDDDILHFDDADIDAVKDNNALGELLEREVSNRLDERRRRVDAAMSAGIPAEAADRYARLMDYLDSITDAQIEDEGDDGEAVRRSLIYNDLVTRGYSQERANREVDKSIKAGTDVEDARDALESLKGINRAQWARMQQDAKDRKAQSERAQRERYDKVRESIMGKDVEVGGVKLDEATRRRAFDAVAKPVSRDKDSGRAVTEVTRFASEDPVGYWTFIGLAYALTDGGRDWSKLAGPAAKRARHEAMKELTRKINNTSVNSDGSLRLVGGEAGGDGLLDGGWKVGFKR